MKKIKKEIFKEHDRVFRYDYGWGTIKSILNERFIDCVILVEFDDGEHMYFTKEGKDDVNDKQPTLSFKRYDLVNGGFSQERPLPNIKVDTPIFVRNKGGFWSIRYFERWTSNNNACCFVQEKTSEETTVTCVWDEWSLTNPIEK